MKNGHSIFLGILVIILSFITGPLGILVSLTGLGRPSILLADGVAIIWVLALICFRWILNTKLSYEKSNKFLNIFLVLSTVNFVVRNHFLQYIVTKQLSNDSMTIVAMLVFLLTPVSALIFYISLLKSKNSWIATYAVIGIFISVLGLSEQVSYLVLSNKQLTQYINSFIMFGMIMNALISYTAMIQSWFLGGILIGGGLLETKLSKKK